MKKVYFLSTCSTCTRIMSNLDLRGFELPDIKTEAITPKQVDEMKKLAGSYEALFSRRAMKYKAMKLAEKSLSETDYRQLIIDEYTFLKRPVVIVEGAIFIGNSKKNVAALSEALN